VRSQEPSVPRVGMLQLMLRDYASHHRSHRTIVAIAHGGRRPFSTYPAACRTGRGETPGILYSRCTGAENGGCGPVPGFSLDVDSAVRLHCK